MKRMFISMLLLIMHTLTHPSYINLAETYSPLNNNFEHTYYNQHYIHNNVQKILIVCPVLVSGGPEALCQLCHELRQQGFDAKIL